MINPMTPEWLFQYTSPDGLIGIVSNKCLWASNAFYLNDAHELSGGMNIAGKQLEALCHNSADANERNRIEWLLNDIRHMGTVRSKAAFVCSFSTEKDLLSQWRGYCRGGGFSIGFPVDQLRKTIATQGFSLSECVYCDAEKETVIKETIEQVALPWLRSRGLPVSDDVERFKVSGQLIWELVRAASRLKDSSFLEEHEWRIVSMPERGYDKEKLFFRARNGIIIPYTTIKLPDGIEFWGKVHIVVGPTPHPDESKASVRDLVRRYHGCAIGIDITCTLFREW